MNADEFYEAFKQGLRQLNVSWGDKDLVTVWIIGNMLYMRYDGTITTITVPM